MAVKRRSPVKGKSRFAGACAIVVIAAAVWFALGDSQGGTGVSLIFERYDANRAFLHLTNTSNKSYYLQSLPEMQAMSNSTNRDEIDAIIDRYLFQQSSHQYSLTLDCEFIDLTPTGRLHSSQWPAQIVRSNIYRALAPHTGVSIEVPVPPEGLRRSVAAPYYSHELGWRSSKFWSTSTGSYLMMKLATILTRSQFMKLIAPQPVLLKARCDTELTNHYRL